MVEDALLWEHYGRHREDYADLPSGMLSAALIFAEEKMKERRRQEQRRGAGVPDRPGRRSGG